MKMPRIIFVIFCLLGFGFTQTGERSVDGPFDDIIYDRVVAYNIDLGGRNKVNVYDTIEHIWTNDSIGKTLSDDEVSRLNAVFSDTASYWQCLGMKCFETDVAFVYYSNSKPVAFASIALGCGIQFLPRIKASQGVCGIIDRPILLKHHADDSIRKICCELNLKVCN